MIAPSINRGVFEDALFQDISCRSQLRPRRPKLGQFTRSEKLTAKTVLTADSLRRSRILQNLELVPC